MLLSNLEAVRSFLSEYFVRASEIVLPSKTLGGLPGLSPTGTKSPVGCLYTYCFPPLSES